MYLTKVSLVLLYEDKIGLLVLWNVILNLKEWKFKVQLQHLHRRVKVTSWNEIKRKYILVVNINVFSEVMLKKRKEIVIIANV